MGAAPGCVKIRTRLSLFGRGIGLLVFLPPASLDRTGSLVGPAQGVILLHEVLKLGLVTDKIVE
jgi:hypothetical protein